MSWLLGLKLAAMALGLVPVVEKIFKGKGRGVEKKAAIQKLTGTLLDAAVGGGLVKMEEAPDIAAGIGEVIEGGVQLLNTEVPK